MNNLKFKSALYAAVQRNGSDKWIDLGFLCDKCVTNSGVDWLAGGGSLYNLTMHKTGTGATAPSPWDTDMEGEAGSGTGTVTIGSSPNIIVCTGVITYSGNYSIVEHGIFCGSVLWDRSIFDAYTIHCGDKYRWTYQLTILSGG